MVDIIDVSAPNSVLRAENQSAYAQRLAAVLGDGSQWEYRGECLEVKGGVCACGHTGLRYLFPIYHRGTGRMESVGSSCIETYGEINPDMVQAIKARADEARRAHLETIREAKRAAENVEVQALAARAGELRGEIWRAIAALPDYTRVAWELWREFNGPRGARETVAKVDASGGKFSVKIPPLKSARGQKTRLEKEIARLGYLRGLLPAKVSQW